jgi:signal peptidase I
MHFDFEMILTLLTLISGLIWLVYALMMRKRAAGEGEAPKREPLLVDYSKSFFPVLALVLVLRSFLAEPFHIPSSSMVPVLHTKVIPLGEPKRGDVVVFRYPGDTSEDYIKRIVGLPGDDIVYRDKTLYINGVVMAKENLGPYTGPDADGDGTALSREHLGSVTHEILTVPGGFGREGEWKVPEGQYFAMGDNRDNSNDSRYWGFVPEANLVGRAFFIWMNIEAFKNSSLWHRVGNVIH